jgi:uncharacterized protein with HEPN domain
MNDTVHHLRQTLSVVEKEAHYLQSVVRRLFPVQDILTSEQLNSLLATDEGVDRLESFVGKFSRMQDTLVDKLLPRFLIAVGEEPGTALDNLRRAERLGLIRDPDQWLAMRRLRNRLVHEYVNDNTELAAALESARQTTAEMFNAFDGIKTYIDKNLPVESGSE